jgi:FtsH-binding integral membrane protein
MDTQSISVSSVAHQMEEQDEGAPQLSFTSIYKHLAEGQPPQQHSRLRRVATAISLLVTLGGLVFSVWTATPNSGYSVHATLVGFGLEVVGLASLMLLGRSHRALMRQTSSHDDMANYDALHAACNRTIDWLSQFDLSNIASMRSTLEEQQKAQEMASGWMFGSAEKLGVLPALAAVLVQGLSITRPTGLAGSVISGLAVGAALGYCGITFVLTRDRVRDRRLAWLLASAENTRCSVEPSQARSTGDTMPN